MPKAGELHFRQLTNNELRACLNFLTTENQWFIQDRFLAATLENWKGWKFGGK
jgi:hypothetical protein